MQVTTIPEIECVTMNESNEGYVGGGLVRRKGNGK